MDNSSDIDNANRSLTREELLVVRQNKVSGNKEFAETLIKRHIPDDIWEALTPHKIDVMLAEFPHNTIFHAYNKKTRKNTDG